MKNFVLKTLESGSFLIKKVKRLLKHSFPCFMDNIMTEGRNGYWMKNLLLIFAVRVGIVPHFNSLILFWMDNTGHIVEYIWIEVTQSFVLKHGIVSIYLRPNK